jgi:hypothetical protein
VEDELMAACQELLRHGLPSVVPRELGDEHRFIPLAVDINGDVAVTAFIRRLRRGALAGRPGLETSEFQQRDGNWVYLGGGAGEFREYPLAERLPAARQHGYLSALSYGQTSLSQPHKFPWNARYVFHAMLQASAEVHRLQAGTRVLDVPFHSHAALIWADRRGPNVVALASDGTQQASMDLSRDPFEVRHRRLPLR